jgi:peptidoglycan/xylan/chitin deacetylase (PgdA/CDA1 family)
MKLASQLVFGWIASSVLAGCVASTPSDAVDEGDGTGDTTVQGGDAGTGGAAGTSSGSTGGSTASGGANGTAGASGKGGATPVTIAPSGMPAPPTSGVAQPSGGDANLKVIDWAGFRGAASYSFDDSQPSQIEHYAELTAAGAHLTFYASTNGAWAQGYDTTFAQAVTDGHEIGNHTVSHCTSKLTECPTSLGDLKAEVDDCTAYITQHFAQKAVYTMAYPYGDMGYKTYAQARFFIGHGYAIGVVGPNDASDPFNLPRYPAKGGEDAAAFNAVLDQTRDAGQWVVFAFHSILPTANAWYANVDIGSITGSIAHGKAEMWLDTVTNIGAYWLGQRLITAAKPASAGAGKTWSWTLPAHFPTGRYVRVKVDGGTLQQGTTTLAWDDHGYYEVALDVGSLAWSP